MLREVVSAKDGSTSYREILRSTALIGASSIVVMLVSLIRMKVVALLLGPAGIALFALYSSITDLAASAAGLGVNQSGVRLIAQAGSEDQRSIADTVSALRQVSWVLSVAGAIALAGLCVPVSMLTFGSADHALAIAFLGVAVVCRIMIGAEAAILQGRRRLRDLAVLTIAGALASVIAAVPLIWIWHESGVVAALVLAAFGNWLAARCLGQRIAPAFNQNRSPHFRAHIGALLRLGFAFMLSGFLTVGAAYAIRILILHDLGLQAAGLYQAAWSVAGLYVGVVLQSMGSDFYPRLTAEADDDIEVRRLVNEQTEISLLLAGPGVIATITLAHLAMIGFYSAQFAPAAELLRWLCLGMMLRVVSWPLGYLIIAKGWQKLFIGTEVIAAVLHVGFAAALVPVFGLTGAGIAFVLLYVCHSLIVYALAARGCAFRYERRNLTLFWVFGSAAAATFLAFGVLSFWWATGAGLTMCILTGIFSLIGLRSVMPDRLIPLRLPKWLSRRFA